MKRLGKKLVRYKKSVNITMNNSFQLIRTKYVNKLTEKWTKTRNKNFKKEDYK